MLPLKVWIYRIIVRNKQLHRVTVQKIPSTVSPDPVVVAYGRLVILGGDQRRLNEEVIVAGGSLREGRFKRLNVLELNRILREATAESVPDTVCQKLVALWDTYAEPLKASLERRMGDRQQSLEKQLQDRQEQEIKDIQTILLELQRSIEKELEESHQPQQLSLFTSEEKEQFERNRKALQLRLEQIPQEIERETEVIRQRFANPTPRLFPLAIAFLVPPKIF